jgi:hypothetical protein
MKKYLVPLILLIIIACGRKEEASSSSEKTENIKSEPIPQPKVKQFPWSKCNTLVFYACESDSAEPDSTFQKFIVKKDYEQLIDLFAADVVPNISVKKMHLFVQVVDELIIKSPNNKNLQKLKLLKNWVQKQRRDYEFVMFEIEPEDMAGYAFPIAVDAKLAEQRVN